MHGHFIQCRTRCIKYGIGILLIGITLLSVRCLYTTQCSWTTSRETQATYRPNIRSSQFGDLTTQSCEPLHPRLVFYNRIFKAASSTMSEFLQQCSKKLGNLYTRDYTEEWENENITHPVFTRVKAFAERSRRQNKRLMAIAHLYFREDFESSYINLLREPVARFISHYYYCRSAVRWPIKLQILKELGQYNVTIEECIENQYEGCVWNHMTRFFCGPHAFCKTGNEEALARAKYNMISYYASVGVVEYLNEFVKVLHKRLPEFVTALPEEGMQKTFVTRGVVKTQINESTMERIKSVNKADIELYQFAKNLFLKQAANCGIKIRT